MAVRSLNNIQRFVGLSTDPKPTGVLVGSEFFESNTGRTYIAYDGTNWVLFAISEYSY